LGAVPENEYSVSIEDFEDADCFDCCGLANDRAKEALAVLERVGAHETVDDVAAAAGMAPLPSAAWMSVLSVEVRPVETPTPESRFAEIVVYAHRTGPTTPSSRRTSVRELLNFFQRRFVRAQSYTIDQAHWSGEQRMDFRFLIRPTYLPELFSILKM
jgi:hypothetical protein